jgi:hypothetical protein
MSRVLGQYCYRVRARLGYVHASEAGQAAVAQDSLIRSHSVSRWTPEVA